MRTLLAALIALVWIAGAARAQSCEPVEHKGNRYTVCAIDMTRADLRLLLYGPDDIILGQLHRVERMLAEQGKSLAFAMNAGMYHDDRRPVGHYVEAGKEFQRVIPNAGPGNFGLLPNGVFCIRAGRADVFETLAFQAAAPDCAYATQSGPMLVIDGKLHPRFLIDSTSRYVRNGVGTSADGGRAVFAISANPVTFHEFGSLYKDVLKLPNALYFDGNISRLYAPGIGRNDAGFALGPIVGLVTPRTE